MIKFLKTFLSCMSIYFSLFIFLWQDIYANQADKDLNFNIPFGIWIWFDGGNGIKVTTLQNDGKIIVWGYFTSYSWISSNYIVRLNSDGSRDNTFNIWNGFNLDVDSIVIQNDGKLIVWGYFTSYSWTTANRIIRLNSDGTRDDTFTIWNGFNNAVLSIALQNDGKIIIGGLFTSYSWTTANYIIRLNSDGTRDNTFSIWNGFNNNPQSITIQNDGKIVIWGRFSSYSWSTANRLIRLNSDGTRDDTFTIWNGFNNAVYPINIQNDGKLIVWGYFTSYSWTTANRIIRLNSDGTRDDTFNIWSQFNDMIRSIAIQNDGKIVVVGNFTSYSWTVVNRIMRFNIDGTKDDTFDIWSGFNNRARVLTITTNGRIIVWWYFTTYKWLSEWYLIALKGTSEISSWTWESQITATWGTVTLDPFCTMDFGSITQSSSSQNTTINAPCNFSVSDYKGANAWWSVTIGADNLTFTWAIHSAGILTASNFAITLTGGHWNVNILDGSDNSLVVAGSLTFWSNNFGAGATHTLLYRNNANNDGKMWKYGVIPSLRLTIPWYTEPGTYRGTITVTLTEN